MFSTEDTIVAIATPPGKGGIGVVRISGPDAPAIARQLTHRDTFEPRHATLTHIFAADGTAKIDETIAVHFPAPHSYTGEDVVEISAHGSPVILQAIVAAAMRAGARLANPGEFTLRAYLHGRLDLIQAEAVAELIDAVTPLQARVAFDQLQGTLTARLAEIDRALLDLIAPLEASLDFPDEGYHFITPADAARAIDAAAGAIDTLLADASRGRMIREGVTAAIVGSPNVGKSSLFNRLAGAARAIVTDVPGTTRDLLTERVDVGGVPFTFVDTAGVRAEAGDAIEAEGIARALQASDVADVVIVVLDRSRPIHDDDRRLLEATAARRRVVVASKCDLPEAWPPESPIYRPDPLRPPGVRSAFGHDGEVRPAAIAVSAITDEGIGTLRDALAAYAGVTDGRDGAAIANLRHAKLLESARSALSRARGGVEAGVPEELVLADLHEARGCFDEIAGARPQDEVLRTIFERFCIGK